MAAGNAALAALVFDLADWGPGFLDLDLVLSDFVPCVAGLTVCGGAVLALALALGVVVDWDAAFGSACAQEVWGTKTVKNSDKASRAQCCGVFLGGW